MNQSKFLNTLIINCLDRLLLYQARVLAVEPCSYLGPPEGKYHSRLIFQFSTTASAKATKNKSIRTDQTNNNAHSSFQSNDML